MCLVSNANTAHAQAAGAEAGVQVTPGQETVRAERAVTGRALGRYVDIFTVTILNICFFSSVDVVYLRVVDPVGGGEQQEGEGEEQPGGDVYLLGVQAPPLQPGQQARLGLVQAQEGGEPQLGGGAAPQLATPTATPPAQQRVLLQLAGPDDAQLDLLGLLLLLPVLSLLVCPE